MTFGFSVVESAIIKDVWIIKPEISTDRRGNIWTSFSKDDCEKLLPQKLSFKHDKFSTSKKDVLRGIHGDYKSYKLVSCVFGTVQQVVVDLRSNSTTYGVWQDFIIGENNQQAVLIPPSMGNAFLVTSNTAIYHYKLAYKGDYSDVDQQFSMKWNDPKIGIEWLTNSPILSSRDG